MSKTKPAQSPTLAPEIDLPEGWAMATLGQLVSPSKEKVEPDDRPDAPYLSLEHIESGTGRILGHGVGSDVGSTKAVFQAGDVLYGKLRPYLNKVCIPEFDGICSTDILVFPQSECVDSRYLLSLLMQPGVVEFANHNMSGVQLPRISFQKLAELEMPLAPLPEQKRIVAKVEELLERVNAARARLAKLPTLLKRFRQSVLAAACSGRLTAEWRVHGCTETVGDLLRAIEATPVDAPEWASELPDSWSWVSFSSVAVNHDGKRKPVKSDDRAMRRGQYPYYGASGIIDSIDDFLFDGEYLLIAEDGANLLSRSTPIAFQASGKFWVNNHAHVVQTRAGIPLQYVECYLNWLDLQHYVTGTAQPKLTQGALNSIPVPLPPLAEQREIVRRVGTLFTLADRIEAHVGAATGQAKRLPQAVLARAFRGELVSTEAEMARLEGRTFEDANALLERVKSAKTQTHDHDRIRKSRRPRNRRSSENGGQVKSKPVATLAELEDRLVQLGGRASPLQLLRSSELDDDMDRFFELLREGRDQGTLKVPVGTTDPIEKAGYAH